ncbi:hypothetical protein HUE87_10925 [Candidatus Sulfurimonas marisnigri]|uniref:Lipoprotein n=1 Tax=Candidatus Sulfurimonas marisnigri TaxID=2740405 RepID=A0A7S7LZL9_9BACT|nr:hypothetical protein [Candidatus Sulfurimonas marisnigri]QOY54377.1 hypothetical protein HUE87_10925 [Candidatus Sulfurimonas marisnigri]
MKYILLISIFFLSACSIKNYEHTQTKIIIIKSPKIKFSDLGYIRNSNENIELELFIAGKAVEKISVNHLICVSEGCMSKSGFNEDYLNSSYPDEMLQNILLAREIYGGKNIIKTVDGFEQNIQDTHVDIQYKVGLHVVFFKDRKNNIIFKIKDTNE